MTDHFHRQFHGLNIHL